MGRETELASFDTRGKGRAQHRREIRGNPWILKFPESTMGAMEEILALIEDLADESLGTPVSSRQLRKLYSRSIEKAAREHILPMTGERRCVSPREKMAELRVGIPHPGRATRRHPPRHR